MDTARAVQAVSPHLSVSEITPMEQRIAHTLRQRHLSGRLCVAFALLAMALSLVGVSGAISDTVNRTAREAVKPPVCDALKQGLKQALAGLAVGLLTAIILTGLLTRIVSLVTIADTLICVSLSVVMALMSLLVCYHSADRAVRKDSQAALRPQ